MWPFKKKSFVKWVTDYKKVCRTIYFYNDRMPLVTFTKQEYTRQPHWRSADNYHFTCRARSFDHEWGPPDIDGFLNVNNEQGVSFAINRNHIEMITYEVVE